MTDCIQGNYILGILEDQEISKCIQECMEELEFAAESMELRWDRTTTDYCLIITITEREKNGVSVLRHNIQIGRIGIHEADALNKLIMAGRRIYFRLRRDFPMLQRKLSKYQYFVEK